MNPTLQGYQVQCLLRDRLVTLLYLGRVACQRCYLAPADDKFAHLA
jgi:hypothetical protein